MGFNSGFKGLKIQPHRNRALAFVIIQVPPFDHHYSKIGCH